MSYGRTREGIGVSPANVAYNRAEADLKKSFTFSPVRPIRISIRPSGAQKSPAIAGLPYTGIKLYILSQIRFQSTAVTGFLQTLNCPFLDLANTLFGKVVFLANLFNGYSVFAIQTEISIYYFCFSRAKRF